MGITNATYSSRSKSLASNSLSSRLDWNAYQQKKGCTKRNNRRSKGVLSLETVGNDGGDDSSSNEERSGNFHLDHDDLDVVKDGVGDRRSKKLTKVGL